MLAVYTELLTLTDETVEVDEYGDQWRAKILTKIRSLGYVQRRGSWVTRERFLREQGWVVYDDKWLRPEEDQLNRAAQLLEQQWSEDPLRTLADDQYMQKAREKRVLLGMNRREVIEAWGYFQDQNTLSIDDGIEYEQFLFENGRQAYLRNGLLCSWSE